MSSNKPWDRPWSVDEIIENSERWSLAGDVALLNSLKAFAKNLINRTTEINNNLNNLTNSLEEAGLQLHIAQNEFQSLRNIQFIESRVYEDDETLPPAENVEKVEEKVETDHTEDIKSAAVKGLEVIDRYFDKVEVSVSDSEDEDIDLPNYVLRPKDLYIDRPLPYVIGTEEWHESWHVGLEVSSSDSETEKVSDKFSESDSESDLPIIQDRSQIKGTSDTSSEFDFSQKTENKMPKQDLFQSSDSEDQNSVQVPVSNSNFAEELAAKLGNVITQELAEPEINRRPIQTKTNYGDIFFDEPPPLDTNKGLFSGGTGLFDDDDEDLQYGTPRESQISTSSPKLSKAKGPSLFDEESSDDDMFSSKKSPMQGTKPPLLSEEPPTLEKKGPFGGVPVFKGANLFDKKLLKRQPSTPEDEETKVVKESTSKKIDLFDDGDLFTTVSKEDKSLITKQKINLFDTDEENKPKMTVEDKPRETNTISLFDDDDDLFKDDLFSTPTKKKFTSGLFDDVDNQDLFPGTSDDKPKLTESLFEDLMAVPDNKNSINVDNRVEPQKHSGDSTVQSDSLFANLENEKAQAPKPKPRLSLFDSPPPEPDDLFRDEYPIKTETSPKTTTTSISNLSDPSKIEISTNFFDSTNIETSNFESTNKEEKISSIFDSSSDNPIFDTSIKENIPKRDKTSIFDSSLSDDQDDLFGEKPPEFPPYTVPTPNLRLFDPSPPPDDDWETKSDNISEENDSITDHEDMTEKTNLFYEEPPSLDFNVNEDSPGKVSNITEKFERAPVTETKANVTSPGKLKHNLKINVGALMPGSLPPKRGETIERSSSVEKNEDDKGFDTTDNVEVLHSVTKDRVRVPLNRRPSTRRGRKAALENTTLEFKVDEEERIDDGGKISKIEESTSSLFSSDFLDSEPRYNNNTLFGEDIEDTRKTVENDTTPPLHPDEDLFSKPKNDDLFGEDIEDLGFKETPFKAEEYNPTSLLDAQLKNEEKEKPSRPAREAEEYNPPSLDTQLKNEDSFREKPSKSAPKNDLFDDEDDDEDIFSSKKLSVQTAKTSKKSSLFDDEDNSDDDDIFKSFTSANAVKKEESKMATEKRIPKMSSVKKLENTKPDEDPLSALLK